MVAAVELIDSENKKKIENIYQEITVLSNAEMVESLIALLEKGLVSINDYNNFILEEGIDERLYKANG